MFGDAESDTEVAELSEDSCRQEVAAYETLAADLRDRLAKEDDPNVRADLGILVAHCGRRIDLLRAEDEHLLGYVHLPRTIFVGLRSLLDERNAPERRAAALGRLQRYVGSGSGETPILEKCRARLRSRLEERRLLAPPRQALERDLASNLTMTEVVRELFESCGVAGFEHDLARLRDQLSEHDAFCREHLLPRARDDFRLPRELYQARIGWYGVVARPSSELSSRLSAGGRAEGGRRARSRRRLSRPGIP